MISTSTWVALILGVIGGLFLFWVSQNQPRKLTTRRQRRKARRELNDLDNWDQMDQLEGDEV